MEPYLGEMRWVAFPFTPRGWMACEGQLLQIRDHTALFAVIGTQYGGDGVNNFALPKVQGRTLLCLGDDFHIGNAGGEEKHVLTAEEMPEHRHAMHASAAPATTSNPSGVLGSAPLYSTDPMMDIKTSTSETGSNEGHDNMQPSITLRCLIAVIGAFPMRG